MSEIVVYENGADVRIDVRTDGETVWLTQSQMAQLFGCTVRNVRLHLENIYACGELEREATRKDFFLVRTEGTREAGVNYLVRQISTPPPDPPRRKIGFSAASGQQPTASSRKGTSK